MIIEQKIVNTCKRKQLTDKLEKSQQELNWLWLKIILQALDFHKFVKEILNM